jgi:cytidylate kinase
VSVPGPTLDRATRPVVTLFESYGCGADEIGPRVAEALGVAYHAQAFSSDQLEDPAGTVEEGSPLSRVYAALGASYVGLEGPAVAMAQRDNYELVLENTRWVMDAAGAGAVIVGRNGALILAKRPGALHVRLDAPVDWRIGRAAEAGGIGRDRAARRQRHEDDFRAQISLQLYGWDPHEPTRYDVVLNPATLDVPTCVDVIVHASRVKLGRAVPAS